MKLPAINGLIIVNSGNKSPNKTLCFLTVLTEPGFWVAQNLCALGCPGVELPGSLFFISPFAPPLCVKHAVAAQGQGREEGCVQVCKCASVSRMFFCLWVNSTRLVGLFSCTWPTRLHLGTAYGFSTTAKDGLCIQSQEKSLSTI